MLNPFLENSLFKILTEEQPIIFDDKLKVRHYKSMFSSIHYSSS